MKLASYGAFLTSPLFLGLIHAAPLPKVAPAPKYDLSEILSSSKMDELEDQANALCEPKHIVPLKSPERCQKNSMYCLGFAFTDMFEYSLLGNSQRLSTLDLLILNSPEGNLFNLGGYRFFDLNNGDFIQKTQNGFKLLSEESLPFDEAFFDGEKGPAFQLKKEFTSNKFTGKYETDDYSVQVNPKILADTKRKAKGMWNVFARTLMIDRQLFKPRKALPHEVVDVPAYTLSSLDYNAQDMHQGVDLLFQSVKKDRLVETTVCDADNLSLLGDDHAANFGYRECSLHAALILGYRRNAEGKCELKMKDSFGLIKNKAISHIYWTSFRTYLKSLGRGAIDDELAQGKNHNGKQTLTLNFIEKRDAGTPPNHHIRYMSGDEYWGEIKNLVTPHGLGTVYIKKNNSYFQGHFEDTVCKKCITQKFSHVSTSNEERFYVGEVSMDKYWNVNWDGQGSLRYPDGRVLAEGTFKGSELLEGTFNIWSRYNSNFLSLVEHGKFNPKTDALLEGSRTFYTKDKDTGVRKVEKVETVHLGRVINTEKKT